MKSVALAITLLFGMSFLVPDVVISQADAKITDTKQNGGGQTPKGKANGVPTVSTNPTGKAPPGQN